MDTETDKNATENTPPSAGFSQMVEESREKILATPDVPPVAPRKNRAGRKPKPGEPSPYMRRKMAQETAAQTAPPNPPAPKVDLAPMIKAPIQLVSRIPAAKYHIPDLAFTDDEAMECAKALDSIASAFVPDMNNMDPKTAAVVHGLLVFGSVGFQKFTIYQQARQAQALAQASDNRRAVQAENETPARAAVEAQRSGEKVDAGDFFQTVHA